MVAISIYWSNKNSRNDKSGRGQYKNIVLLLLLGYIQFYLTTLNATKNCSYIFVQLIELTIELS